MTLGRNKIKNTPSIGGVFMLCPMVFRVISMLVAGSVDLIAAKISAGECYFGGTIDRIDRHIADGSDIGISLGDEWGAGRQSEIEVPDGRIGEERLAHNGKRIVQEFRVVILYHRRSVVGILRWIGIVEIGGQIEGRIGDIGGHGFGADAAPGERTRRRSPGSPPTDSCCHR